MDFQNIFYGVGLFLLFVTVAYFAVIYLDEIPDGSKIILSFLGVIILFLLGDYLRRLDK